MDSFEKKKCNRRSHIKPISEFIDEKSGKEYGSCNECRQREREYKKKLKEKEDENNKVCSTCGKLKNISDFNGSRCGTCYKKAKDKIHNIKSNLKENEQYCASCTKAKDKSMFNKNKKSCNECDYETLKKKETEENKLCYCCRKIIHVSLMKDTRCIKCYERYNKNRKNKKNNIKEGEKFCNGCNKNINIKEFEGKDSCNKCRTNWINYSKRCKERVNQVKDNEQFCNTCNKIKNEEEFNGFKTCNYCRDTNKKSKENFIKKQKELKKDKPDSVICGRCHTLKDKVEMKDTRCIECYHKTHEAVKKKKNLVKDNEQFCSQCNKIKNKQDFNGNKICIQCLNSNPKAHEIHEKKMKLTKENENYCKACHNNRDISDFGDFLTCNKCRDHSKGMSETKEDEAYCKSCSKNKHYSEFNSLTCKKCLSEQAKNRKLKCIKQKEIANNNKDYKFCSGCATSFHYSEFNSPITGLDINICKKCVLYSQKSCKTYQNKLRELYYELKEHNTDNEKICITCLKFKSTDNFVHQLDNSLETLNCLDCRKYSRKYANEHLQRIREIYTILKIENSVCSHCGLDDHRVIQFHHINPSNKKHNVLNTYSMESMLNEFDKCISLCGICHIRVNKENGFYLKTDPKTWCGYYKKNKSNIDKRRKYINDVKKEIGGCVQCGWFDENLLEALHFDHIDQSTKLYNVSEMKKYNLSFHQIQSEIDKCRLLCCHCHKIRTIEQMGYTCY